MIRGKEFWGEFESLLYLGVLGGRLALRVRWRLGEERQLGVEMRVVGEERVVEVGEVV